MTTKQPNTPNVITVAVHMIIDGEEQHGAIGICKVHLETDTKGVIVKDGRPVSKEGDRWVYRIEG